jgi:hypothetical protein
MRDFEHVHVKFVDSPITARLKGGNKAVTSVRPPFGTENDLKIQLDKRDLLNKQRCNTTSNGHRPVNNVIVDRYPTITNLKDHYSSLTQKEFRVRKKYFDPQAVTDKTKQLEHIERLLSHAPTRNQTPGSGGRRDRVSAYTLPIIKKNATNDEYDNPSKNYRNILNYSNDEYDRKSSSKNSQRSNSSSGRKLERQTY